MEKEGMFLSKDALQLAVVDRFSMFLLTFSSQVLRMHMQQHFILNT